MSDLQRTDQWHQDRAGRITASRFIDALAFGKADASGKRKPLESRTTYMRELCFERLASRAKHSVSAKALSWGTQEEQGCHDYYELISGNMVTKSGFMVHPKYDWLGCSPDGLIGADGGIESKCPYNEAVHIRTWIEGMPEEHTWQVQGCMFVTGRKWWDFLSYDPRQNDEYRLYVERIERDQTFIDQLHAGLVQFNLELNRMVDEVEYKAQLQAQRLSLTI
ncbi:lambda exonuclease family protein [Pseudomonas sp.]|uniref:lambda exonuclease family protein n=1 Tax=Pseudomonas sp. TaxID=306 RepID=UPI002EDAB5DC